MREMFTFECTECKRRNYTSLRNKKAGERLQRSKYCPFCRGHKPHKELK